MTDRYTSVETDGGLIEAAIPIDEEMVIDLPLRGVK
jgi:hypothetical protein